MASSTERRKEARKRPLSLVYVELPPANGGMMRDLSERGFSLRAMMPLRPSEKVPFSFQLDPSARIDGEAIVVRLQDTGHVAALEFAGLSVHAREQIRRWLSKNENPFPPEGEASARNTRTGTGENSTFEELRSEIRSMEARPVVVPVEPEVPMGPASVGPPAFVPAPEPPAPEAVIPVQPTPLPGQTTESPTARFAVHAKPEPPVPSPDSPALLRLSSVRPDIERVPAVEVTAAKESEESEEVVVEVQAEGVPDTTPVSVPPKVSEELREVPRLARISPPLRPIPPALEPLSSLEGETDASAPMWMERFTLGRAIGIMLVLTCLAGSFVFRREVGHALIWIGQQIAGDESPESLREAPPAKPAVSSPQTESSAATTTQKSEDVKKVESPPPAPLAETSEAKSSEIPPATQTPTPQTKEVPTPSLMTMAQVTKTPPVPAPVTEGAGQMEYRQAEAILRTPGREAEVPAAARLLWTAVEKGNVSAEIALAELYWTGKGVARNCTQAKILLATAAHKGSAEAQQRLNQLEREGCKE